MRLTDPVENKVIYQQDFPSDYATVNGIEQAETKINHSAGTASIQNVWFEGLHVSFGSVQLFKNFTIKAECDTPVIEMHFATSGGSEAVLNGTNQRVKFSPGQHNICYMPEFEGYFKAEKQAAISSMVEVHVTETYFNRFANAESMLLDRFQEQIIKKRASMLSPQNLPITALMQSILKEIVNCKRNGIMKRLFLEARMLELLMLQMEQFESAIKPKMKDVFSAADIEKLHDAKALIEQNLSLPPTLAQVSRTVGLNDFKLKKGFKHTFGTTVFGYLHDLRMQEARRMLLDTNKSIHEISDFCGYSYVQHFTTAFRTRFGVTPGSFRA